MRFEARQKKYDVVLHFHASPSSSKFALATGAKIRAVHFHGHKDRNRFSTVEIPGKGTLKPIIERDMDVIRALGVNVPAGRLPLIHLSPAETQTARERLGSGRWLGLGLGASRPTKSWGLERFAQIAQAHVAQGGKILAITGPDEQELAQQFGVLTSQIAPADIRIESRLKIRELAALISQCQVFLGNDSGPRHLAVAVGVPTLTLFGPEDPFEWHPYPQDQHPIAFQKDMACRKDALPGYPAWCGLSECVIEKHRCMTEITVDEIQGKLRTLGAQR